MGSPRQHPHYYWTPLTISSAFKTFLLPHQRCRFPVSPIRSLVPCCAFLMAPPWPHPACSLSSFLIPEVTLVYVLTAGCWAVRSCECEGTFDVCLSGSELPHSIRFSFPVPSVYLKTLWFHFSLRIFLSVMSIMFLLFLCRLKNF